MCISSKLFSIACDLAIDRRKRLHYKTRLMKAHDLATLLLSGEDLLVQVCSDYGECSDARDVMTEERPTERCANCVEGCEADGFGHAGADNSGPCTRVGCNPMCRGWKPKVERVVVIS